MNYRKERKFVVTKDLAKEVEIYFRNHPLRFKTLYPKRKINTLYFDDYSFSSYVDSSSGNSSRSKYRIRWYGENSSYNDSIIYFEIKSKNGNAGLKKIFPINNFNKLIYSTQYDLKRIIRDLQDLPIFLRIYFLNCFTSLFVKYERKYFISSDHSIRITFDENINYAKPNQKPFIINNQIRLYNSEIIEIKYDNNYLPKITFPDFFRPLSRNSKYTNGIDLIYQK